MGDQRYCRAEGAHYYQAVAPRTAVTTFLKVPTAYQSKLRSRLLITAALTYIKLNRTDRETC